MEKIGGQFGVDQEEIYMTLPELGILVRKFSNVTLGKDKVKYGIINAKEISNDGINYDASHRMREKGSKRGVLKYAIRKGDIIFPYRGRLKSMSVVTENTITLPLVGHHGLMQISCGYDNLDLAYFIKDYLQMSSEVEMAISSSITSSGITVNFLNSIKFPISSKELIGYKDASINTRIMLKVLREAKQSLDPVITSILQNAIQQNNDGNTAIAAAEKKFIEGFRELEEEYRMEIKSNKV